MSEWPDMNDDIIKKGNDFEVRYTGAGAIVRVKSKKPHYKAKPISTFNKGDTHYTRHDNILDIFYFEIPDMGKNGIVTFNKKYNFYKWYTSNGNIYEYTLKIIKQCQSTH